MNPDRRTPEFIGSSIYCLFEPIHMLITARHVLERILPNRAWFPFSNKEMREVPCEGYAFPKNEEEDTGILELSSGLAAWSPLSADQFSQFSDVPEYQHILLGYPSSLSKEIDPKKRSLEIKGYLTSPSPPEKRAKVQVDANREFVVEFRKENVYERDLHKTTFPDPNGMSGGAVLQFHESNARVQRLVGIMTRWDAREQAIVATRIETITQKFSIVRIDRKAP